MKVIITEKPSVAKDIARVLKASDRKEGYFQNKDIQVTWAFGHLIQLVNPEDYGDQYKDWRLETLPIMPETFKKSLQDDDGVKKQFKTIASLITGDHVNEVICATDAGREGELIFRYIYEEAACNKPIKRLWISSQTDKAIKEGFEALRDGDDYVPLFHSAVCRSEADWLVGMNASRAYTLRFSYGKGVLSVGRVQTPVLKMIVDRYRAHIDFKPETYHEVHAEFNHKNGRYAAKWFKDKIDRITKKTDADVVLNDVKAAGSGAVVSLTQKEKAEKPPLLYDLTELQKDANKRFKFSADKTLKVMQNLYEQHKVLTYPRTSSRYLSEDIVAKLPQLIANVDTLSQYQHLSGPLKEGTLRLSKRIVDDKKVTDHHAIIPTDQKPNISRLNDDERKVYDLVIKRFLAAFMPDCLKDHTEIISEIAGHQFRSTGTVIKRQGWREAYLDEPVVKEEKKTGKRKKDEEVMLPRVAKGDDVSLKSAKVQESKTKAPALYNEAGILASMETAGKTIDDEELRAAIKDCGLGTPATRAQILERLIKVGYIVREKNKLTPTAKGEYIIANIREEALLSPELTGQWEKKLNDMAQNRYKRDAYMKEIRDFTQALVDNVKAKDIAIVDPGRESFGDCPVCDGKVVETKRSYGCSNWKAKDCSFVVWKTIANKDIKPSQLKKLLKSGKTDVIKGFKSKTGNKFDAALTLKDGKAVFAFSSDIGPCPKCDGRIVENPKSFGCNMWKDSGCDVVIWKEMAKRKITEKEVKILLEKGKTDILKGFTSKAGKDFEAAIMLVEGRAKFAF